MTISVKSDAGGQIGIIQVNGQDTAFFKQGQSYAKSSALTDGATVNWDGTTNGQVVTLTTAAARTFGAPTNIIQNACYILVLTTGGYTPSWNVAYKWASGMAPAGLESATYVYTFIGGASNTMIPCGPGYKTGA